MKKVVETSTKTISLMGLVKRVADNDKVTVVYKIKSDEGNYAFFSKTSNGQYGFRNHAGFNKMSFVERSIMESLQSAMKTGRELLVFERDELCQLFKF